MRCARGVLPRDLFSSVSLWWSFRRTGVWSCEVMLVVGVGVFVFLCERYVGCWSVVERGVRLSVDGMSVYASVVVVCWSSFFVVVGGRGVSGSCFVFVCWECASVIV